MVICSKCYLEFHLRCAIDGDELSEDTEGGAEVDPKHCPRCRGEYVDPEVKAAADMWCRTISAAKVRRLTFEIFKPISELYTTHIDLKVPTVQQIDRNVMDALLAGEYCLRLGYREPRLGDKDLGQTLDEMNAKRFQRKPDDYDLSEFAYLAPGAAAVLAKHKGELDLSGLAEISDRAAAALAKHRGSLNLDGLTNLSDMAVEALAKHRGDLIRGGASGVRARVTEAAVS